MALNYSGTMHYLFSRLPVFQRVGPAAYKNSLDNTVRLDNMYGHPHRRFKSVHVGGTNGKGSVSHMLAAVLQSAGYRTGLYTSPHLKDFRERIRINGEMIAMQEVVEWVKSFRTRNKRWKIDPSFFELTVAMAFDFFSRKEVDIAIIEVGLGGRLDSTNIITPEVSIITNIGMDHTALLGHSPEAIAAEKAGIIKPGVPVVLGTMQGTTFPVFERVATEKMAPLFIADREFNVAYALKNMEGKQALSVQKSGQTDPMKLTLDLKGMYQQKNLPAVLKCVEILQQRGWKITEDDLAAGLSRTTELTGLTGRWQEIGHNPLIVCDTAHNAEGVAEVVEQIKQTPHRKLHIVWGMVNDKVPGPILSLLPADARYYFTRANIPRALNEEILARIATSHGLKGAAFSSVGEAYREAMKNAGKDDFIFVGGSTFVVSEVL